MIPIAYGGIDKESSAEVDTAEKSRRHVKNRP